MTPAVLLYLALGILSDLFATGYYLCVARGWACRAATTSMLIALLNFWVLDRILVPDWSWANAVAYALGNAVGCMLIMRVSRSRR
jgi:hypothetical protein